MAKNIRIGIFAVAGGTADAITAAYTPTTASLYNGLYKQFRAIGANTVVAPTLNVDGLGAKAIVKKGGNALVVGDIAGAGHVCEVSYNSTSEKWELLNPASDLTDSIFEETGGVITPQTLTDILRLGAANPGWGLSALEIYSTGNDIPIFLGDIADNFLWIQDLGSGAGFEILAGLLNLNAIVTTITQNAGDNSTKVATTEYVDTGLATKASKTFVENISFQDASTGIVAQTYTLELYAQYAYTINELKIISDAGTCSAAVKINGTDVTGISAVAVSTTMATGTATAANTVAVGDKITLVISTTSGLDNLQASLKTTRI